MIIQFDSPKPVVDALTGLSTPLSTLTIDQIVDRPEERIVLAYCKEFRCIVLWKGADYDTIGQWTDTDVINRIHELYP